MSDVSFYPHGEKDSVECRETHISMVFLVGDWAYKLKKPVYFGFLDFRTLEARRHFCEQEVVLNQRLTRGIYKEVVAIGRLPCGRIGLGEGEPVEYAVKMKRLPDSRSLMRLLMQGEITAQKMERLGELLAGFYERSERGSRIDRYGEPEMISFNMEENFVQIEPFVENLTAGERWEFIREVSRNFLKHRHSLFKGRIAAGRIRDGHGDLRPEHVYFWDGIQIIDCIEFNERFRYGDVASDLAYLIMDMDLLGFADLSIPLLESYVRNSSDMECYSILDFYALYRALVKVKVACFRSTETADIEEQSALKHRAGEYLDLAYRYAVQFGRPILWVVCGLAATGKSTMAAKLGEIFSISVLRSDNIRKRLLGLHLDKPMVVPYGTGIYRAGMRQRVYSHLLGLAMDELKQGRSVVLDATFSQARWREEAQQLGRDLDASVIFVECISSETSIKRRLNQRKKLLSTSDARLEHFDQMIASYEPLREIPKPQHIRLDTDQPLGECLLRLLSDGYAKKRSLVDQLVKESRFQA